MRRRALGIPSLFVLLAVGFFLAGCSTSHVACPGASGLTCGCGAPPSAACPIDALHLVYATTTSNQIWASRSVHLELLLRSLRPPVPPVLKAWQ